MWESIKNWWLAFIGASKPVQTISLPQVDPIPKPPIKIDQFPWMTSLRSVIGQPTVTGSPPTVLIKEAFSHTSFGDLKGMTPSSCAAGACWALEKNGYDSPHDASAISFKGEGVPCQLQDNCIVVLKHLSGELSGHFHVTFCSKLIDAKTFIALGFNQDHKVCEKQYSIGTDYAIEYTGMPVLKDVVKPVPLVPSGLSWDAGDPVRKAWSKFLIDNITALWAQYSLVQDLDVFYENSANLSVDQKIKLLAEIFCWTAYYESGWDPSSASVDVGTQDDKDTWSIGLLQMSVCDQESYGIHLGYDYNKLLMPIPNLDLGTRVMAQQIQKRGRITLFDNVYWSTLKINGKYSVIDKISARTKKMQF